MLECKCFVDPLSTPFSRRGSYLAFANKNEGDSQFGKNTLYLTTCKGGGSGMSNLNSQNSCRQMSMELLWKGQRPPTGRHPPVRKGERPLLHRGEEPDPRPGNRRAEPPHQHPERRIRQHAAGAL